MRPILLPWTSLATLFPVQFRFKSERSKYFGSWIYLPTSSMGLSLKLSVSSMASSELWTCPTTGSPVGFLLRTETSQCWWAWISSTTISQEKYPRWGHWWTRVPQHSQEIPVSAGFHWRLHAQKLKILASPKAQLRTLKSLWIQTLVSQIGVKREMGLWPYR